MANPCTYPPGSTHLETTLLSRQPNRAFGVGVLPMGG
jgi:hypothetical protein